MELRGDAGAKPALSKWQHWSRVLLSTSNVARGTEEMNFNPHFIITN